MMYRCWFAAGCSNGNSGGGGGGGVGVVVLKGAAGCTLTVAR